MLHLPVRRASTLIVSVFCCCLIHSYAQSQATNAEDELSAGTLARDSSDYDTAMEHYRKAVLLAPQSVAAHYALASLAGEICNPNAEQVQDSNCNVAIREYERVLQLNANHRQSLKSLAYLLYEFNRWEESEEYYQQSLKYDSTDAETACGLAAIDFYRSWHVVASARADQDLPASTPLINTAACGTVRSKTHKKIDEGIKLLIPIAGSHQDLAGYLSVLYQAKSEVQCGDPDGFATNRRLAEDWNAKRIALAKSNTGQQFLKCPPAPPPVSR